MTSLIIIEVFVALISIFHHFDCCYCHYNVKLASEIALEYFPGCHVITLASSQEPSSFLAVSDLQQSLNEVSKKVFNPKPSYLIGLQSTEQISGLKSLRKHTHYCNVILTLVSTGFQFNATKFLNSLTTRESPISLRDVDHYVFLLGKNPQLSSDDEAQAKAILSSKIKLELRYKLVLFSTSNQNKGKFVGVTYCLYCAASFEASNALLYLNLIDYSIHSLFPDFTNDLNGHQLKVVGPTKYVSLYEMEKIPGADNKYEHKRGLFKEFFFIMQAKLNFTYRLKPCSGFGNIIPEGNTGTQLPNGTWAGCVADIYYRWADISMGGSPAGDRLHYVDFSTNMRYDYVQFFTHRPKTIYPWTVAFACFDIYGWIGVLLSCIIAAIVLYKTEAILVNAPSRPNSSTSIFYLYAYLVGQDLSINPKSISSKVTYVYWLYYGIIIGASYTCSLQSLIVSPGQSVVPETMPELARSSPDWRCGVPLSFRNGLAEVIFKKSKNPDMRKLYRETQEDKDAVECLKRAATSDYACFHWQIMAEFYMGTVFIDKAGNHPFLYAKDYILFSGPTWMTRKREIWRHAFNDFFGRQFSMGIVYETSARDRRMVRRKLVQEVRDGKRKPLKSYTDVDDGPKPFAFENVKACFIVLQIGLVISTLIYIKEMFPKWLKLALQK